MGKTLIGYPGGQQRSKFLPMDFGGVHEAINRIFPKLRTMVTGHIIHVHRSVGKNDT